MLPLCLAAVLSLIAMPVSAQAPDGEKSPAKLTITAATLDSSATQIRITGENFGKQAPDVYFALESGRDIRLS